jgi:Predicted exporters of the RND superfamily
MKRFSHWVTKHYITVLIIGVVVLIASIFGLMLTKINYDILSYLPNDLNSTQGEHILDNDFKTAGSAMLLTDVTDLQKAKRLKDEITAIPGVENVTWLDSAADIFVPRDQISESIRDQFIKGDVTLMTIQFEEPASSQKTFDAIEQIKKHLDSKTYLGGVGALLNDLRHLIDHEKIIYVLIAVALILVIIGIALDSFMVPLLFLASIGMAIAYNMGTNFLKGNISYITSAIAAVLQLGVTMDFSIFLYHRFEQERQKTNDKFEAMANAMSSTSVAILASSLATAAGFIALVPMKIKIGEDMGIVLAKGVILGVITALTVLPSLLLLFDDLTQKTRHKAVLPSFRRTSEFVTKHYRVIFIIFLILFIPAYYGKANTKIYYNIMDAMPSNMQSMKSTNIIKDKFGVSEIIYLITDKSEPRYKEELLNDEIKKIENVKSSQCIESMADARIPESFLPNRLKDQFQKGNYRYILISLKTKGAEDTTNEAISKIDTKAHDYYGSKYYLSGEAVLTKDLIGLVDKDIKTVDMISIGAIFLILLLAYKSISLPVILVGVIELAIFFNLGIPYFTGTTLPFIASLTIGSIQLGSTVNYSILMVSRYREELLESDRIEAMKNAIRGTGPSIITSALTLAAVTFGVGAVSQVKMIGQFATMIGRGTLISFVCIMLALPSVLLICDYIISHTSLGWKEFKKTNNNITM